MLNPLDFYTDIGRRSAKARKQGDESLARFEYDYMRRCLALETIDDRRLATKAYGEGYRAAADRGQMLLA